MTGNVTHCHLFSITMCKGCENLGRGSFQIGLPFFSHAYFLVDLNSTKDRLKLQPSIYEQ